MVYENLICIMNKRNYASLMSMFVFKPKVIVFLVEENDEVNEDYPSLKVFYERNYPGINCIKKSVKSMKREFIYEAIKEFRPEESIVSLFGDATKAILNTYITAKNLGMKSVYVDTREESMMFLDEDKEESISHIDMDVLDFIGVSGGVILEENTNIFSDIRFINMSRFIMNHRREWEGLKRILRNYDVTYWDRNRINVVQFSTRNLSSKDYNLLIMFLKELRSNDLGRITSRNKQKIFFKFHNLASRNFIGKVGTWLEVLAYNVINELGFIEDAKAGVVFLWDRNEEDIKNEADVLAAYNSYLVYISCKDTSHYDANTLNELEVYSRKIGGKAVKKLLISTKKSYKNSTDDRAEEMGINIIIFDGNIEKLKDDIRNAILDME